MECRKATGEGGSTSDPSVEEGRCFLTVRAQVDGLVEEREDYTIFGWVSQTCFVSSYDG